MTKIGRERSQLANSREVLGLKSIVIEGWPDSLSPDAFVPELTSLLGGDASPPGINVHPVLIFLFPMSAELIIVNAGGWNSIIPLAAPVPTFEDPSAGVSPPTTYILLPSLSPCF